MPSYPAYDPNGNNTDNDEVLINDMGDIMEDSVNDKLHGGHHKVFTRFGQQHTHNEELCVGSCGVILGHATFYGAEGPNSVQVSDSSLTSQSSIETFPFHIFWKGLFPTEVSLPAICWYDNNCKVAAMLAADGETYFDHVALPIDMFHFKSKHRQTDAFCGWCCNLAHWIELTDEHMGQWIFNSSAAEQVNLSFGGF